MRKNLQKSARLQTNKVRYSSYVFGLTLLGQLFIIYSMSYFVQEGMITFFLASVAKIIMVMCDGANDVFFGFLSEKTKSRWGKRLPWIVGGMPFFFFFIVFTFLPKYSWNWSPELFFFYYLFFSVSYENSSTVMYINYNALFPVYYKSEEERAKTSSFKHVFEIIAMGICNILTPILVKAGLTYFNIGLMYGLVFFISTIYAITGFKNNGEENNIVKEDKQPLLLTLKQILLNKSFIFFNFTQSFFNAIMSLLVTLYPMYCTYVINVDGVQQALIIGALFVSLMGSIPLWNKFIKKKGARLAYKISYTLLPFGLLLFTFPTKWWHAIIICILVGPIASGLLISPDILGSELIDIDKMKYHISREASYSSLGSLVSRISVIITSIVMLFASVAFGYNSGTDPGPNPSLAFRMMIGVILASIGAIGTVLCYTYLRISKKEYDKLRQYNAINENNGD